MEDLLIMEYIGLAYVGVIIILAFRSVCLEERLKKYVDKQYPEEGKVIRAHEWQYYPWSTQARTLRALVKKQSGSDPELAYRAKKAKRNMICILVFLAFLLLESIASFIYYVLLTPAR